MEAGRAGKRKHDDGDDGDDDEEGGRASTEFEIPAPLMWDKFLIHTHMTDDEVLQKQSDYWLYERWQLYQWQIQYGFLSFWPVTF